LEAVADPPGTPAGSHDAALAAGAYVDPVSARAAVSRGKFLTGVTLGLGGLIGAAITVPVIGFALGPSFAGEKWYWVDLGSTDQYPQGKFTTVVFERAPNTGYIDRRVAFVRKDSTGNPPAFTVISNTCMHVGCPVQASSLGFACPCHGGQYDTEGRRTAGPPVRPLNRYETNVENGNLYIGRAFASKLENGQVVMTSEWKDPGQPVQGLLSFLYPPAPR
jgi:menaquinol-cytochrome c reductase iron-sulfur subunit